MIWGYESIIPYIEVFFAVFARCLGLVISVPVFGGRGVPVIAKIGLAIFLAGLITPILGEIPIPQEPLLYSLTIAGELFLGLAMGYIINLIFVAIQIGGSFIDLPIGFRAANLVDPQWGYPVPLIGHFKYFMALALFFIMDGHHLVLKGLVESFQLLPKAHLSLEGSGRMAGLIVKLFAGSFSMALQMSLPVAGTLFLVDCAFAMLARASPQINVFLLGFAVKILVGLAILSLSLPYFLNYFSKALGGLYENLMLFIDSL